MSKKRVLITGAAGFLGSHLCDRFIKEGYHVIGMDNLITGDLKNIASNVEKVEGVSTCKTGKMGATSSFEIKYNPKKANIKDIHSAIENTSGCENPNDRPYKVK